MPYIDVKARKREFAPTVAELLDRIKERHNLPSDYALGRFLGVEQQYLDRWKAGEFDTALAIIGPALLEYGGDLRRAA